MRTAPAFTATEPELELSVVIPCLNEADTLARCVEKARRAMREHGIVGEIVVADNGSTDGSIAIATGLGARLVHVSEKGYGSALMGGIESARGRFVIMGDADDSYDFLEIPRFVEKLREGHDLVQGCRLPAGGGAVKPGAMPFLHRWCGNPMFTLMARAMFGAPVHDIYCGLRGFKRDWQLALDQRCTGMEFATEMLIKAALYRARIAEVPVTLHPDGREAHPPHLKTFRDGWRTLRFFLVSSPRWLFVMPGLCGIVMGLAGYALALPGTRVFGAQLDVHTLLFASLALLLGWTALIFGVVTKAFSVRERLLPPSPRLDRLLRVATLERSLVFSAMGALAGAVLLLVAVNRWRLAGFGPLDYASTMRVIIPGATLVALGVASAMGAFVMSMFNLPRR